MLEQQTPSRRAPPSGDYNEASDDFDPESMREHKRARLSHEPPQARRSYGSSIATIATSQLDNAVLADPNRGRCLLTHQLMAVEAGYLVSSSLSRTLKNALEQSWGMEPNTLNLDTRYNIIFLRADLQALLDSGYWMLLPDPRYIEAFDERLSKFEEIEKLYGTKEEFDYYFIPLKEEMQQVLIDRIVFTCDSDQVPSSAFQYTYHTYPYANLGPIPSHVQPHFALYNTGTQLAKLSILDGFNLPAIIATCLGLPTPDLANTYIKKISNIYKTWIAPPTDPILDMCHPPSELQGGTPGNATGHPGKRSRRRSNHTPAVRSIGNGGGGGGVQNSQSGQGGHRPPSLRHTSTISSEKSIMEDQHFPSPDNGGATLAEVGWIKEYVSKWLDQATEAVAHEDGWEPHVLNDRRQLWGYAEENCRTPFQEWNPTWMKRGLPEPDTSRFSSNDWSLKIYSIRLPDPVNFD